MKALGRRWLALLLLAGAWVPDALAPPGRPDALGLRRAETPALRPGGARRRSADGRLGRSLSPRWHRFQLDASVFPSAAGSQICHHCHPKAGAAGESGTACPYDRAADGTDLPCCVRAAASAGLPLAELPGEAGTRPGSPSEPGTPPPRRPSAPVAGGERRDAGPALPAPGPTLAMVAMGSILAAVGMLGCYRSARRRRHRAGAPREPPSVAMVPTASASRNAAPGNPGMV